MQNRNRKDDRVNRREFLKLISMTLFLSSCKQVEGMVTTQTPTSTFSPELQGFPSTNKTIAAGRNHTLEI